MKNYLKVLILTVIIFIFVTLITMKIQTPFDGNDTYGFPFIFHIKWSGMCYDCPENLNETYFGYLLADLIFSGIIAGGIYGLLKKFKKINEKI